MVGEGSAGPLEYGAADPSGSYKHVTRSAAM